MPTSIAMSSSRDTLLQLLIWSHNFKLSREICGRPFGNLKLSLSELASVYLTLNKLACLISVLKFIKGPAPYLLTSINNLLLKKK
jgi:hypothetical protein